MSRLYLALVSIQIHSAHTILSLRCEEITLFEKNLRFRIYVVFIYVIFELRAAWSFLFHHARPFGRLEHLRISFMLSEEAATVYGSVTEFLSLSFLLSLFAWCAQGPYL